LAVFSSHIHDRYLADPDEYWDWYHIDIMWALGVYLDALFVLTILFAGLCVAFVLAPNGWAKPAIALVRRVLDAVDGLLTFVSAVALSILVCVTLFSVIGRKFYRPIPDDITIAEWAMVTLVCLMLGTLQGRGEHIEVTALADRMSARVNQFLRLIGLMLMTAFVARLMWVNLDEIPAGFLEETYGSIYELPLWPPRLMFFIGVAFWLFRAAIQFLLLTAVTIHSIRAPQHLTGWNYAPVLPCGSGGDADRSTDDFVAKASGAGTGKEADHSGT
jgi:TRAP-type C4-dicarboxylate transport system permease small subunit